MHTHCLFHTLVSQIRFPNTVLGPVDWKCVTLTPTCSKHTHTLKCHPTLRWSTCCGESTAETLPTHTHSLFFSLVAQWVLVRLEEHARDGSSKDDMCVYGLRGYGGELYIII